MNGNGKTKLPASINPADPADQRLLMQAIRDRRFNMPPGLLDAGIREVGTIMLDPNTSAKMKVKAFDSLVAAEKSNQVDDLAAIHAGGNPSSLPDSVEMETGDVVQEMKDSIGGPPRDNEPKEGTA